MRSLWCEVVNWYRYISKPQEAAGHWALTLCSWEGNRRSGMTRSSRAALRTSREWSTTCGLEEKSGGRVRTAVVRVSLMVTGQLADAIGDFAFLVFVLLAASRDRELTIPSTYILVRSVVWECGEGQTDRRTDTRRQLVPR